MRHPELLFVFAPFIALGVVVIIVSVRADWNTTAILVGIFFSTCTLLISQVLIAHRLKDSLKKVRL